MSRLEQLHPSFLSQSFALLAGVGFIKEYAGGSSLEFEPLGDNPIQFCIQLLYFLRSHPVRLSVVRYIVTSAIFKLQGSPGDNSGCVGNKLRVGVFCETHPGSSWGSVMMAKEMSLESIALGV